MSEMPEAVVLIWQNGEAVIFSGGAFFRSPVKPALSFSFDELVCESPSNVYFRMLDGTQFLLSEEEVEECRRFCENFAASGDCPVYAYDPADGNLYRGRMTKAECGEKGYAFVADSRPESAAAAWDEEAGEWKLYHAAITEDGALLLNIDSVNCPSCAVFLTREEYEALPAREHDTDSWDFASETWVDRRDLEKLKKDAVLELRNLFEGVRWKRMREFVPQYEQDTWRIQLDEARAFTADHSASTPYMDAFLAARTDASVPDRGALAADILANHETYVKAMAEVNARQWSFMKAVQSAATGYDVDALCEEFRTVVHEALSA